MQFQAIGDSHRIWDWGSHYLVRNDTGVLGGPLWFCTYGCPSRATTLPWMRDKAAIMTQVGTEILSIQKYVPLTQTCTRHLHMPRNILLFQLLGI